MLHALSDDTLDLATTAALMAFVQHNIAPDIQEILVYGNPSAGVIPGALRDAVKAAVIAALQPVAVR